jgi:hypothetical protein
MLMMVTVVMMMMIVVMDVLVMMAVKGGRVAVALACLACPCIGVGAQEHMVSLA